MPFGLGGRRLGASLGPTAIRIAGLQKELEEIVAEVTDMGDVRSPLGNEPGNRGEGIGHFEKVLTNLEEVKRAVSEATVPRSIPLVLGGDHSLAVATVSAALEQSGELLGVLWVDAHGDLNTPDTSPSGNLHGMSLAALCGLRCGECPAPRAEQWARLLEAVVPERRLDASRIVWFGLRDPDRSEVERITSGDSRRAVTMHEIDRFGIPAMVEHAVETLRRAGVRRLWVSFDLDVLDPMIAPGTGTDVRGGLSYREAHLLAEMLHETLRGPGCPFELVGIEIVEVNPTLDTNNETAVMAVEWVTSLLGRRILPAWPSGGDA